MSRPRLLCRPEHQQPDNQSRPPGPVRRSKSAARAAGALDFEFKAVVVMPGANAHAVHSASCLNPGYANASARCAQSRARTPALRMTGIQCRSAVVRSHERPGSSIACSTRALFDSTPAGLEDPRPESWSSASAGSSGRHDPVAPVALDVIAIEHHHLVPNLDEVLHEALLATAAGIHVGDGTQLRIRPEDQVVA